MDFLRVDDPKRGSVWRSGNYEVWLHDEDERVWSAVKFSPTGERVPLTSTDTRAAAQDFCRQHRASA